MRAAGFEQPRPVGRALRRQFDPSGGPGRVPAVRPALRTGSGAGDPLRLADRAGRECARPDVACPLSGRRSSPIRHPALAQGGPARFRGGRYLTNAANRRRRGSPDHISIVHLHMWSMGRQIGVICCVFQGLGSSRWCRSRQSASPARGRGWISAREVLMLPARTMEVGFAALCTLWPGARSRSPRVNAGGPPPRPPGQRGRRAPTAAAPPGVPSRKPVARATRRRARPPRPAPLTQTGGSSHRGRPPGRATAAPRRATAPPPPACSTRHPKIRQRVTAGR